jgi:hypothetical protein
VSVFCESTLNICESTVTYGYSWIYYFLSANYSRSLISYIFYAISWKQLLLREKGQYCLGDQKWEILEIRKFFAFVNILYTLKWLYTICFCSCWLLLNKNKPFVVVFFSSATFISVWFAKTRVLLSFATGFLTNWDLGWLAYQQKKNAMKGDSLGYLNKMWW